MELDGAQAIPESGVEEMEVRPRQVKGPDEPSQEVERHNCTHCPAKPWSEACIRCKANDAAHSKQHRMGAATPVLQFDYAEAGTKDDIENFE